MVCASESCSEVLARSRLGTLITRPVRFQCCVGMVQFYGRYMLNASPDLHFVLHGAVVGILSTRQTLVPRGHGSGSRACILAECFVRSLGSFLQYTSWVSSCLRSVGQVLVLEWGEVLYTGTLGTFIAVYIGWICVLYSGNLHVLYIG